MNIHAKFPLQLIESHQGRHEVFIFYLCERSTKVGESVRKLGHADYVKLLATQTADNKFDLAAIESCCGNNEKEKRIELKKLYLSIQTTTEQRISS